jgi:UDP-N-acetyl-alpha-D-muramoyl-L-alanyl-L-glutamate epimerase
MRTTLKVEKVEISQYRLFLWLKLDDLSFSFSVWFPGIDLHKLCKSLGEMQTRNLLLHAVLFDLQNFMTGGVEVVDVTAFNVPVHDELEALWKEVATRNWDDWRDKNKDRPPIIPELVGCSASNYQPSVLTIKTAETPETLLMFSGGKDSLASSIILEKEGTDYDTFFVLQSKDGRIDLQRKLIDDVLKFTKTGHHREVIVSEDYMLMPIETCTKYKFNGIAELYPETIDCMFKTLLYAVACNYDHIILSNEAASDEADDPSWKVRNGQVVTHQWGKSSAAEDMVNSYVSKHLISNLHFTSLLRKMEDPEIFDIVKSRPDVLRYCHSCNVFKPWCKRCSKCCYIWLSYCAYLGYDFAISVFQENLFDIPENLPVFRELYAGERKPFECIGRRDDVILAFNMCKESKINGRAVDEFQSWIMTHDKS